jgi:TonB family protein
MRHKVLFLLVALLLTSTAFGSDKRDEEAAALIARAKQLSDIRAEGAPAFRLKIGLKTIKDDGSASEGEYTEVWVSRTKWRREAVVGDLRRIQIASEGRHWVLGAVTPRHVGDVYRLSDIRNLRPDDWKPRKLENREVNGIGARCLETASSPNPSAACFDKTTGVLISETTLSHVARAQMVCSYADYEKFGDRVFARSYACYTDGHKKIEARVLELTVDPTPDPALFVPPDGAEESESCLAPKEVPIPLRWESPSRLPRGAKHGGTVVMSVVVGIDGKSYNLRIVSSTDAALDQAAMDSVKNWRFNPAMCDGEPTEIAMQVEVGFRSF